MRVQVEKITNLIYSLQKSGYEIKEDSIKVISHVNEVGKSIVSENIDINRLIGEQQN